MLRAKAQAKGCFLGFSGEYTWALESGHAALSPVHLFLVFSCC